MTETWRIKSNMAFDILLPIISQEPLSQGIQLTDCSAKTPEILFKKRYSFKKNFKLI